MIQEDFLNVLKEGRLSNSIPWTLPIVLDTEKEIANQMKELRVVVLCSGGEKFGIMHVEEIYGYEKENVANAVYGTTDVNHPGVNRLFKMKEFLVGGGVEIFHLKKNEIQKFRMHPSETRSEIVGRGWKTVVGFQTRNVPHVAHEMLQKVCSEPLRRIVCQPANRQKKDRGLH